jgi:putative DNA primase/helicase
LTGENNLKQFFILLGEKDTGKSLFLHILNGIFESFAGAVNDRVFKQSKSESIHDTEAFDLMKKRVAFVSELNDEEAFNEKMMKKISGGDEVSIRACQGSENVNVLFNCILLLATNEIPKFKGKAFADRMCIISFHKKFKNDPKRRDEILSHTEDFFSVACKYAKLYYYDAGMELEPVDEVKESTQKVKDEKDSFKMWLEEDTFQVDRTKENDKAWRMKKTVLYANYTASCYASSIQALGRNTFYARFNELHPNLKTYDDGKFWCGVREKVLE